MHINEVKLFLEASSKEELVKKQIENNRLHGYGFKYDAPMKEGKKWVVWFTANVAEYFKQERNR